MKLSTTSKCQLHFSPKKKKKKKNEEKEKKHYNRIIV